MLSNNVHTKNDSPRNNGENKVIQRSTYVRHRIECSDKPSDQNRDISLCESRYALPRNAKAITSSKEYPADTCKYIPHDKPCEIFAFLSQIIQFYVSAPVTELSNDRVFPSGVALQHYFCHSPDFMAEISSSKFPSVCQV